MPLDPDMKRWLRERDVALITLDMEWARNAMGRDICDAALLAGMHKARYNIPGLPDAVRHRSAEWLRERGLPDINGVPLLPPGQLPE
jgi:hypothetical protein